MNIPHSKANLIPCARGFGMIELMVSIVISTLLLAAVSTVYMTSKQTFYTSNNVARIQENSRFALWFINHDLRMAGFAGCTRNMNSHLNPAGTGYDANFYDPTQVVGGWEFTGTTPGDAYSLTTLDPSTVSAGSWEGLNTGSALANDIAVRNPIPGSDVLVVKRANTLLPVRPDATFNPNLPIFNIDDARAGATPSITTSKLLVVGNCEVADLIQNTQDTDSTPLIGRETGSGNPGNLGLPSFSDAFDEASDVYAFTSHAYYIAVGADGGPSLFRLSFSDGMPDPTDPDLPQELVEGVENMQVLYGEDTSGDGIANKYVAADDVATPAAVVAVRVSLLMRALTHNEDFIDASKQFFVSDNTEIQPVVDPNHLRYIASSTVQLRNMGL